MAQLELFPRKEIKSLSDFHRLQDLSLEERQHLIQYPEFFHTPKANEVIRRQHAALVDKVLGVRVNYIEEMLMAEARGFDPDGCHETLGPSLHKGIQTWVGLEIQTLQTPYAEILRMLQLLKLKPYQHVVDLGSAYGRMGIVIGGLFIKNSFTGFEYVKARVDEGNRLYRELGLKRCQQFAQDLSDENFILPDADVYFMYDFGQVEHIEHNLNQIRSISKKRPVRLVVRGKFTKEIISSGHPWLNCLYERKNHELFSIYGAYSN